MQGVDPTRAQSLGHDCCLRTLSLALSPPTRALRRPTPALITSFDLWALIERSPPKLELRVVRLGSHNYFLPRCCPDIRARRPDIRARRPDIRARRPDVSARHTELLPGRRSVVYSTAPTCRLMPWAAHHARAPDSRAMHSVSRAFPPDSRARPHNFSADHTL